MDSQGTVSIGPEFFAKAIKDYSNPTWAWVREAFQNSIDAGAAVIDIKIEDLDNGGCELTVLDDGRGMDENTLFNKFLCLGGSGKDMMAGSVGGFGKAKELLLLGQTSYSIRTRNLLVEGSGGAYQYRNDMQKTGGCKISAKTKFNSAEIRTAVHQFVLLQDRPVVYSLDGVIYSSRLRKNTLKKSKDDVRYYVNHSDLNYNNLMVVRVEGIPMFSTTVNYKKGVVIIELPNSSKLTSNRDGLVYSLRNEIDWFVNNLTVNKSAAFNTKTIEYLRYKGSKVSYDAAVPVAAKGEAIADVEVETTNQAIDPNIVRNALQGFAQPRNASFASTTNAYMNRFNFEFLIKNSTGLEVPSYYRPDTEKFCKYAQDLATVWMKQIVSLATLLDLRGDLQIGFVLDEEAEAIYEKSNGVHVFLINPAKVVKQEKTNSRSFKNRYSVHKNKMDILSVAVHEMVHGLGYHNHDEDYAGKLTDAFAVVMKNMAKIK